MRTSNAFTSPNFAAETIPVKFILLHYTGTDLRHTMEIFADPNRGVAAHFVLDVDGTVYDLGGFLNGPVRRGAHAGESAVTLDGERFTTLNQMSIGIEIVNLNGNLFDFTEAQYEVLGTLLKHLAARFPDVGLPGHVLGHEQVAGFRGKCDPGRRFDWPRVLSAAGLPRHPVHEWSACTDEDLLFARARAEREPHPTPEFWARLSLELEARIKARGPSTP